MSPWPPGGVEVRDPVWQPWHPREVAERLREQVHPGHAWTGLVRAAA